MSYYREIERSFKDLPESWNTMHILSLSNFLNFCEIMQENLVTCRGTLKSIQWSDSVCAFKVFGVTEVLFYVLFGFWLLQKCAKIHHGFVQTTPIN